MVYLRFILLAFLILWVIYYSMLFLHTSGKILLTKREMTFGRMMVPFYYWIAPTEEKPIKKKKKRVKPIRKKEDLKIHFN